MNGYWRWPTKAGSFYVKRLTDGWHALFEDEDLGPYETAQSAAEDLANGHTTWPSCGDPSTFGLPTEISEWQFVPLVRR